MKNLLLQPDEELHALCVVRVASNRLVNLITLEPGEDKEWEEVLRLDDLHQVKEGDKLVMGVIVKKGAMT